MSDMHKALSVAALVCAMALAGCSATTTNDPSPTPSATAPASPALDDRPVQEQLVDAVLAGDVATAQLALEAGADPNLLDAETRNDPLSLAVTRDDVAMVELLLDHDAMFEWPEVGFSHLQVAAEFGGADVAAALLAAGADPNGVGAGIGGPLAIAAYAGNVDVVAELLAAGANPNQFVTDGRGAYPPLFSAAYGGSDDAAVLLLQAGADVSVRSPEGHAPSDWADSQGHDDLADFLRSVGA